MPRPQRDLDPDGGPVVRFAAELRALRESAGTPKFETMARRTGRSKSTLAGAVGGRHLPRWETVVDFVHACGADPESWRARWEAVRAEVETAALPAPDEARDAADVDAVVTPEDGADAEPDEVAAAPAQGPAPDGADIADDGAEPVEAGPVEDIGPRELRRPRARRPWWPAGLAAAAAAVVLVAAGFLLGRQTALPAPGPDVRAVEVQNKVALGADRLVEDRTPAYLSALPLAYCAAPDRHCKVGGTEMTSGAAVVASCTTLGQQMWNYNVEEPAAAGNPDRSTSALWYRASFPDGRVGFISEVYLGASSRGGLGLPDCGPTPTAPGPSVNPVSSDN